MPIFQPMPPEPTQLLPMPLYAWPTAALYNNYSRYWTTIDTSISSISAYCVPWPLGCAARSRDVEDGHWWVHRNPTGHDGWVLTGQNLAAVERSRAPRKR